MRRDFQATDDYEPLTRPGSAAAQTDEPVGFKFQRSASGLEPDLRVAAWTHPLPSETAPKPVAQPKRLEKAAALLKRGHAVSFAGLFLFTFVLYFRPSEFSPALSFLVRAALFLALFTLIVYVPTQLGLEGNLTRRTREVNLILLLAVAGLLSISLALDRQIAWDGLVEYLKVIAMFIVLVNVVRTEKRLKALILLSLFVSCIVAVAAVNDYRLDRLVLGQHQRIQGLLGNMFDNPNDLALHLVTMVPLAVALLLGSRSILKKLAFLACSIIFVAGIVATFSRGGFIGLVAVIAVLGWKLARRNRVLLAAVGLAFLLLVIAIGPGGYKSRLTVGNDGSAMARTDELKRSIFMMLRHPIFGVGVNNYILYSNTSHATHNAYTQVGSEMGAAALLFYIMFLVSPLKSLAKIRRSSDADQRRVRLYYLSVGLQASIIGYMASSFFLSVAYLWYGYYLVGYAIALRCLFDNLPESQLSESTGRQEKGTRDPDVSPV